MRHRVAVKAEYDCVQPGTLYIPDKPAYFFCEIPASWAAESARLQERLFAVGLTDLHALCAGINAWQHTNRPQSPDVDVRLRSVQATILTLAETEASPWLLLPHPLRYPSRCLAVSANGTITVVEANEFQKHAQKDIPKMRATLSPMPRLPTDELVERDIFGLTFLFYGDRLVTQKNENQPGNDYCGFDTYVYHFSLYRRSAQELVTVKEYGVYNTYAPYNPLSSTYVVSHDNGGTWDPDPAFDGSTLNNHNPVWPHP